MVLEQKLSQENYFEFAGHLISIELGYLVLPSAKADFEVHSTALLLRLGFSFAL